MPNQNVFCIAPWYELHVYWNGVYGVCCRASHKIHDDDITYNIRQMSIREWYNSQPMRQSRLAMHQDQPISFCSKCYKEEKHAGTGRRHRCNQKSVLFVQNFNDSYLQSPGYTKFEMARHQNGHYEGMPIDIHLDLGNYCNLACKMCTPDASSKIAAQHVKWGIKSAEQYLLSDWTRDQATWNRALAELAAIPELRNIHFMGGETLITKRLIEFIDFMDQQGRHDLSFSFVTNGTIFDEVLMDKLLKFQRIGIEVSIETVTSHNRYQRQGTDTDVVLQNIEKYLAYCDQERITLTARPAISALTVGYYPTLLEYCLQKNILIKSTLCSQPRYYDATILPRTIKDLYAKKYTDLLAKYQLDDVDNFRDYNQSDPHQIRRILKDQISQVLDILGSETPDDSEHALKEMVSWCRRWDDVYGYDAVSLYPEFHDLLHRYGY